MKLLLRNTMIISLLTAMIFILIEGASSFAFFFMNLGDNQIIAERLHTEYDPLLGWINKPNVNIKDMYGPGKGVITNSQRFRNLEDFDVAVPEGKMRWICTGDSFTFGYGVDNKDTWCNLFSQMLPQVQSVNMGQGGYGVDQAYLWYMRDGLEINHQLLIFAFVTGDIFRMMRSEFIGYPKPLLRLHNGEITKQNVPVPKLNFWARYLPRYEQDIRELKMVQLFSKVFNSKDREQIMIESNEEFLKLLFTIFKNINDSGKRAGRKVLFVHLPTERDYQRFVINKEGTPDNTLISFLKYSAKKEGFLYFNLIEDFQTLNASVVPELFIQKDIPGFASSAGHYTEKGNRYISDLILKKMTGNPETAKFVSTLK